MGVSGHRRGDGVEGGMEGTVAGLVLRERKPHEEKGWPTRLLAVRAVNASSKKCHVGAL